MSLKLDWRGFKIGGQVFSTAAGDYLKRLQTAGLRVGIYDAANARLIDRLFSNGGNFWPDSGAFNAMAGYLFPSDGSLIPLNPNHEAGTMNAFVTGDWNAVTGLKGDGSTKFINSNRNNNADGQDDQSMGVYITTASSRISGMAYIGSGFNNTGSSNLFVNSTSDDSASIGSRSRNASIDAINIGKFAENFTGYFGQSRENGESFISRADGTNFSITRTSQTPFDGPISVFTRTDINGNIVGTPTNARQAIYHIGPNLSGTGELAELDAILTDWQTDLANA